MIDNASSVLHVYVKITLVLCLAMFLCSETLSAAAQNNHTSSSITVPLPLSSSPDIMTDSSVFTGNRNLVSCNYDQNAGIIYHYQMTSPLLLKTMKF